MGVPQEQGVQGTKIDADPLGQGPQADVGLQIGREGDRGDVEEADLFEVTLHQPAAGFGHAPLVVDDLERERHLVDVLAVDRVEDQVADRLVVGRDDVDRQATAVLGQGQRVRPRPPEHEVRVMVEEGPDIAAECLREGAREDPLLEAPEVLAPAVEDSGVADQVAGLVGAVHRRAELEVVDREHAFLAEALHDRWHVDLTQAAAAGPLPGPAAGRGGGSFFEGAGSGARFGMTPVWISPGGSLRAATTESGSQPTLTMDTPASRRCWSVIPFSSNAFCGISASGT